MMPLTALHSNLPPATTSSNYIGLGKLVHPLITGVPLEWILTSTILKISPSLPDN